MAKFIFQSSLPIAYRDSLERLIFFNQHQRLVEKAIAKAVELYGSPTIISDAAGLRVAVSARDDVQCLFALVNGRRGLELAGMVVYLRTSIEEIIVLHIAVADRFSRTRRSGVEVVMTLARAVRETAHRLRGVEWLKMLYLEGRQFRLPLR